MKKSSLRSFGIACFVIGLLITFSEKVNIPFISSSETKAEEQYKSKISQLEQQLQDANEQITGLEQTEPTNEAVAEDKPSEEQKTESEEKPVASDPEVKDETVTDTLYVYAGLTPAEVAQKLKDMNIIKNSVEMELFLAQPEYATTIQKGQFELNSSMSVEEIANIITGKLR
ncbi:hypothetical protein [Ureibacillus chungkukjangi]|uniref:YceG-like family protein n=1 Tax=Ureibacillus chungkukjangi TaxID=1202712 RepID=A0A318TG58_9BACL|nr:hypothetical protein [Ureibacillus chungkukjangi]MCM3389945.1 hypothetical protein [Ureibacillus chungkukjangi]PYF03503.1 hypothetical protein BJ095_13032 [Ureibacillus chungkukjangi]